MKRTPLAVMGLLLNVTLAVAQPSAELIITGGKVVTLNPRNEVAEAVAITGGNIVAVGTAEQIAAHRGRRTQVIDARGKTVTPGFIETHCHSIGVARDNLRQQYAELTSIGAIQAWIRQQAAALPKSTWIRVPRNEITRLDERRFPTVAELDAAAPDHPVMMLSVTHYVLNSAGFKAVGITDETKTITGGTLVRDEQGKPAMILDGSSFMSKFAEKPGKPETDREMAELERVLRNYNAVGITTIFERATDKAGWLTFQTLRERGKLPLRVVATFRSQFKDGAAVAKFTRDLGIKPGDGDAWIKAGPLKITVDGGIHWGTTWLSEAYGEKRAKFYFRPDPAWHGNQSFTVERMTDIFATGHKLGWQMSAHVTGDGGTMAVLEALKKSDAITPAAPTASTSSTRTSRTRRSRSWHTN
jgi:hypothetical protein